MEKVEIYMPQNPIFFKDRDTVGMPLEIFQEVDSFEEAAKEFKAEFDCQQLADELTVERQMDGYEKSEIRKEYTDIVENLIPEIEKELEAAKQVVNDIKKTLESEKTIVKDRAYQVKRGLVAVAIDPAKTYRVPSEGNFYHYSYINGMFRLVKVEEIPTEEKAKWYNANWNLKQKFASNE